TFVPPSSIPPYVAMPARLPPPGHRRSDLFDTRGDRCQGPRVEPVRDVQTVTARGEPVQKLPFGVILRDTATHVDDRGTVFELYDPRWGWSDQPLVFSYCFTIRPGIVKGWNVHKQHEDRYVLLFGEMKLVLYDDRPDSPTNGLVSEIILSQYRRQLVNVPIGVWHADQNIGASDVVVVNFPTIQYDHANPDKYPLPNNNDRIPYRFEGVRGG
ncbi:MAG: dTDP-4-dehydrorhamnose 3,5-epimerase, partial [Actinomycetota bacterium]|nr:dTDP-4-dehydrorhamnose 3,5-epimerase [Actinomycetota bacterium]